MSAIDRFCAWLLDLAMRVVAWYVFIPAGTESEA